MGEYEKIISKNLRKSHFFKLILKINTLIVFVFFIFPSNIISININIVSIFVYFSIFIFDIYLVNTLLNKPT